MLQSCDGNFLKAIGCSFQKKKFGIHWWFTWPNSFTLGFKARLKHALCKNVPKAELHFDRKEKEPQRRQMASRAPCEVWLHAYIEGNQPNLWSFQQKDLHDLHNMIYDS